MKQTYTFVQCEGIQYLRKREAVILILIQETGEFILECYLNQGSFYVDFISDHLQEMEGTLEAALRILEERNIRVRSVENMGDLFPLREEVACLHLILGKGAAALGEHRFLICELKDLLKYMEMNVFVSPEGKKALTEYLKQEAGFGSSTR